MKKESISAIKKRLAAWKKAEKEQAEAQKVIWNTWVQDFDPIKGLSPIEKAEAWLHQIMIKGKSIIDSDDWNAQLTVDEFVDQEALIYFVSRGVDCREQIKNMSSRLKEQRKKSETFVKTIESWPDKKLRFMGFRKKKKNPKKSNEIPSPEEAMWRNTIPLTDDDQSHKLVSTYRTIEWCDIGGFDDMWQSHVERLGEDVSRGGEIQPELASQFLFNICRSDFAIEIFEEDLLKLLSIVETPDYQLTIPWHRWNHDDMSLLAGIKSNSIFAYAASIAFSNSRIRKQKTNKEVVNQALKWLLESQEKNGSWKFSTVLGEQSILATCMVVHALALSRPRGWKSSAALACEWLLSRQDDFGFWYESPFPPSDPVYLTVLVLDTLELANGGSQLTFKIDKKFSNLEVPTSKNAISQTINVNGELILGDKYNVGDNNGGTQNFGKNIITKGKDAESRIPIIVAIIGLAGVVLAAIIGIIPDILQNKGHPSTSTMPPINTLVVPTSVPTSIMPSVEITSPQDGAELSQRHVDVYGTWENKLEEGQELWLYVNDRSAKRYYLTSIATFNNGTWRAVEAFIGAPDENGTEYKLGVIQLSLTESQKLNSDFIEILELPPGVIKLTEITIYRRPVATPTP